MHASLWYSISVLAGSKNASSEKEQEALLRTVAERYPNVTFYDVLRLGEGREVPVRVNRGELGRIDETSGPPLQERCEGRCK